MLSKEGSRSTSKASKAMCKKSRRHWASTEDEIYFIRQPRLAWSGMANLFFACIKENSRAEIFRHLRQQQRTAVEANSNDKNRRWRMSSAKLKTDVFLLKIDGKERKESDSVHQLHGRKISIIIVTYLVCALNSLCHQHLTMPFRHCVCCWRILARQKRF